MPLKWKASYQVGHSEIDAQHLGLFDAVNRFLNADDRDNRLLSAISLSRHTRAHFEYEEVLMRQMRYPDIGEHFKAHTDLLSKLTNFSAQVADDSIDRSEWEAFFSAWLLNHLVTLDAKLVAYIAMNASA